jgi:hypothetical protein
MTRDENLALAGKLSMRRTLRECEVELGVGVTSCSLLSIKFDNSESKLLPCALDSFIPSHPIHLALSQHYRIFTHIPITLFLNMSHPPVSQAIPKEQAVKEATAIKDYVLGVLTPHNTWTEEQKGKIHAGFVEHRRIQLSGSGM